MHGPPCYSQPTSYAQVATHLGWDNWGRALAQYVATSLWGSPTVEDLMDALAPAFAAAGSPHPRAAFLPWLQRSGYPVVTLGARLVDCLVDLQV